MPVAIPVLATTVGACPACKATLRFYDLKVNLSDPGVWDAYATAFCSACNNPVEIQSNADRWAFDYIVSLFGLKRDGQPRVDAQRGVQ